MLSYDEYDEIITDINTMDDQFTDDVIEKGEYYEIEEDPITLLTVVTIFDVNGAVLASAKVEDMDTAIEYMEELFDLEPIDTDDIDAQAAANASRFGHASSGNPEVS